MHLSRRQLRIDKRTAVVQVQNIQYRDFTDRNINLNLNKGCAEREAVIGAMRCFFRAEVIGFLHTVTAFHCDLFQGEPLFTGTADNNFFMLQIKFIGLHIEHPRRIV